MVAGIYGDIYLGATSLGHISVYTTQTHGADECRVEITVEVLSPTGEN